MQKFYLSFLLAMTISGCGHIRDAQDSKIRQMMQENKVPALSMVVIENGVARDRDYTLFSSEERSEDRSISGVAQDPGVKREGSQKVFEAASLSKPLFAYGVMKMVNQGLLDLDRPLVEYLPHPDIQNDPRVNLITARMALSHSTGLAKSEDKVQINFTPGSKFSYSGQGFVYLQKVVEHLSGQSLEEYMQKSVLEPLGMTSSSYVWKDEYEKMKIRGYNEKGVMAQGIRPEEGLASYTLHTTTSDYAKFVVAVINGEGLKKQSFKEMLTSQIGVDENGPICVGKCSGVLSKDISWGLGFGIQKIGNSEYFWHWGVNDGVRCYFAGSKNGKSIVIFTNSDSGMKIIPRIVLMATGVKHPAFRWIG